MMIWRGVGTGQLTRLMQDARELERSSDPTANPHPKPLPKTAQHESAVSALHPASSEAVASIQPVQNAVSKPFAPTLAASAPMARVS